MKSSNKNTAARATCVNAMRRYEPPQLPRQLPPPLRHAQKPPLQLLRPAPPAQLYRAAPTKKHVITTKTP